jgi:hypothetical protein
MPKGISSHGVAGCRAYAMIGLSMMDEVDISATDLVVAKRGSVDSADIGLVFFSVAGGHDVDVVWSHHRGGDMIAV